MNIPPKYEDVVAQLEAALGREAALREDLEMCVKSQLGISISEPGESFVQTTLRLYRMSKRRAAEFGIPEGESLEADIEAFEGYDALQQRLTVAEQRNSALEAALKFYADGDHLLLADADAWDTCSGEPVNFLHDDAGTASVEDGSIAKAALKPAEGAKS